MSEKDMSIEDRKLVISFKKESEWLKRQADCMNEIYNRLSGKLLTTLEVALPTGRQLEALKERTKDIQGEFSDAMSQESYSIFAHRFTKSDEIQEEGPSVKNFRIKVRDYWGLLERHIVSKFGGFRNRILNLVTIGVEGHERQEALKGEIGRIIQDSSLQLRSWLGRGVHEILLEMKE